MLLKVHQNRFTLIQERTTFLLYSNIKYFLETSIKQDTQDFNPIKKKIRMGWKKNTFSDQLFILCVNVFRYHSKLDFESPIELLNDQPFTKKFKGKVCRRFFALLMNAMGTPLRITKRTP